MMKIFVKMSKRRDKRFLRRLERLLDENILETNILFRGRIGGVFNYIIADKTRNYVIGKFNDGYTGEELAKSDSRFEVFSPLDAYTSPSPTSNQAETSDVE